MTAETTAGRRHSTRSRSVEHDPDPNTGRCRSCGELSTPYDTFAAQYVQLMLGRRAHHLARTIEFVTDLLDDADGPSRTLVDLACGPGLVSAVLAVAGWQVTGVDASAALLQDAELRLTRTVHADAADCGLPDAQADVVLSTYSHTDVPSWPALVAEAHRLLRPGGSLVYVGAHPAFVGPHAERRDDDRQWPMRVAAGHYHDPRLRYAGPGLTRGGLREHVGVRHLTLTAVLAPVLHGCWQVERIAEDLADPPTLLGFRAVRR